MSKRLVFGVGYNDADYCVSKYEWNKGHNKIIWRCPYYARWCDMLRRAYSKAYHKKYPTYIGCSVCKEWLTFSNFRGWMEDQKWEGNHLDKDIINTHGKKIYSPDNCVFIKPKVNTFMLDCKAARGDTKVGVFLRKSSGRFLASCNNPFEGSQGYIGSFHTEEEAHEAWRVKKHEYALMYAETEEDERVKAALETMFKKEVWYL